MTTWCSGTGFAFRAAIFRSITLENTGLHSNEMITPSLLIEGIESGRPKNNCKRKEFNVKTPN